MMVSQDAIVKPDIIRGSDRAFFLRGFRVFISTYLMLTARTRNQKSSMRLDIPLTEPQQSLGINLAKKMPSSTALMTRSVWLPALGSLSQPQTSDDGSGQHEN